MTGKLSIRTYLTVLALAVLAFAALATVLPHDPYIRAQSTQGTIFERTRYLYERVHFDPTPIDIVFIGSSRTAAGVNPALLERSLAERGLNLHVANLSLPASGMDIRVAQARDVLRAHPEIRLMVIDVVEQLPREGHQAFADLATTHDILTSPVLVNRNLPGAILRLPTRQLKLFTASLLPDAFGYQARFDPALYPGTTASGRELPGWRPASNRYPLESAEHARELEAEAAMRLHEITRPLLPGRLAWLEFGVSRSSIDALEALARENGIQIAFLFQPFYRGFAIPNEAGWLARRAPLWNADFMREDASGYVDAAHPSPLALPRLNDWLAGRISAQLDGGGGTPTASATE